MGCFKKMLGMIIIILLIIIYLAISRIEDSKDVFMNNTNNNSTFMDNNTVMKDCDIVSGISNKIIRFHIRANDDTKEAQNLKLYVKNKVITYIEEITSTATSIDDTREILTDNLENIKSVACDGIKEYLGSDECTKEVTVYIDREYFPVKIYKDYVFPQGEYEALIVNIGEGKGKNWWCVLYPPLCYADAIYSQEVKSDTDTKLKDTLTEEEYEVISGKNKNTKVKIHFKYLGFLNDLFNLY